MTTSNQQYRDLYKKLSEKKREVIASPELDFVIDETIKSFGLDLQKSNNLIFIIKDLLYEIYKPEEALVKIKDIVNDEKLVSEITNTIKRNILDKIDDIYNLVQKNITTENVANGIENVNEDIQIKTTNANINQKIYDISNKYSLNQDQTNKLVPIVEDAVEQNIASLSIDKISNNLNISNIISEQIALEIEKRILNNPVKNKVDTNSTSTMQSNIPEIPPNNLPMVEKQPIQRPAPVVPTPNYSEKPKVVINNEPVQTPVSVPRFKAVPLEEGEIIGQNFIPEIKPKPNASGIMDSKLNSITKSATEEKPQTPPQRYTVDPYREPLN